MINGKSPHHLYFIRYFSLKLYLGLREAPGSQLPRAPDLLDRDPALESAAPGSPGKFISIPIDRQSLSYR